MGASPGCWNQGVPGGPSSHRPQIASGQQHAAGASTSFLGWWRIPQPNPSLLGCCRFPEQGGWVCPVHAGSTWLSPQIPAGTGLGRGAQVTKGADGDRDSSLLGLGGVFVAQSPLPLPARGCLQLPGIAVATGNFLPSSFAKPY